MLKTKNKKIETKYIILIILIVIMVFLAIFSYTLNGKRNLNPAEQVIKDVVIGAGRVVQFPFKKFTTTINNYFYLKNVREENSILKKEMENFEKTKSENLELKNEIKKLKEELGIDFVLTDYTKISATVTNRNIGFWYNNLTINKGSKNGIKKDMIVVSGKGVVGKIIDTSNFTSTVKLITATDSNSKISVSVTNGDYKLNGLIYDYDEKKNILKIEGISNTESVTIGDTVYTSGLGGIFPSGIIVGIVKSIETDNYGLSKLLMVTPSADFSDISYVYVLKRSDTR